MNTDPDPQRSLAQIQCIVAQLQAKMRAMEDSASLPGNGRAQNRELMYLRHEHAQLREQVKALTEELRTTSTRSHRNAIHIHSFEDRIVHRLFAYLYLNAKRFAVNMHKGFKKTPIETLSSSNSIVQLRLLSGKTECTLHECRLFHSALPCSLSPRIRIEPDIHTLFHERPCETKRIVFLFPSFSSFCDLTRLDLTTRRQLIRKCFREKNGTTNASQMLGVQLIQPSERRIIRIGLGKTIINSEMCVNERILAQDSREWEEGAYVHPFHFEIVDSSELEHVQSSASNADHHEFAVIWEPVAASPKPPSHALPCDVLGTLRSAFPALRFNGPRLNAELDKLFDLNSFPSHSIH